MLTNVDAIVPLDAELDLDMAATLPLGGRYEAAVHVRITNIGLKGRVWSALNPTAGMVRALQFASMPWNSQ